MLIYSGHGLNTEAKYISQRKDEKQASERELKKAEKAQEHMMVWKVIP